MGGILKIYFWLIIHLEKFILLMYRTKIKIANKKGADA
jgi:hypothetical protein